MADVDHLAKLYCTSLYLDQAFKELLLKESLHSIRRVALNLASAAEFAATRGLKQIDLDTWGDQPFFSSAAPKVRRELA